MAKKKVVKRKKRAKRARRSRFRLTVPQLAAAIEMLSDKRKHELLDRTPELERIMRFRWLDEVSKRKRRALRKRAKRTASESPKGARTKKKKKSKKAKRK